MDSVKNDYYERQANSRLWLRRWFHQTRQHQLRTLVDRYYRPFSGPIVDIGTGNCLWNSDGHYPVIGVDSNLDMLRWCLEHNRIDRVALSPSAVWSGSSPLVVCAETLEHIQEPRMILKEIYRILRFRGRVIISVPFDKGLSAWRLLFGPWCWYQGRIKGDRYYQNRCGHINHFGEKELRVLTEETGFCVLEMSTIKRFTLFLVGEKVE